MGNKDRMETVIGLPPNFAKIDGKFNVKDKANILYCYGTKIYNPDNCVIPSHLIAHEATHSFRQEWTSPDEWWDKYIENPRFRLSEEIVAHRVEWGQFIKDNKDRNEQARYLHFICNRLSGPLYEGMCSFKEARQHITGVGLIK